MFTSCSVVCISNSCIRKICISHDKRTAVSVAEVVVAVVVVESGMNTRKWIVCIAWKKKKKNFIYLVPVHTSSAWRGFHLSTTIITCVPFPRCVRRVSQNTAQRKLFTVSFKPFIAIHQSAVCKTQTGPRPWNLCNASAAVVEWAAVSRCKVKWNSFCETPPHGPMHGACDIKLQQGN